MSCKPPIVVATVVGPNGFATVYVDFSDVVAADGPVLEVDVQSQAPSRVFASDPLMTFAGTIDGKTYSAGEILTFVASAQVEGTGTYAVDIPYRTAKRQDKPRVLVELAEYTV